MKRAHIWIASVSLVKVLAHRQTRSVTLLAYEQNLCFRAQIATLKNVSLK